MPAHIAVDIGGTRMRAAVYHPESEYPIQLMRTNTQLSGSTPVEVLVDLIARVWPEDEQILGIGIAAPGPLDPFAGVVIKAPNIPSWVELPLKQILEERFQVPVSLGNDANLAALGEWTFGAGKGHHHLIYLTVSTGVGSGVIVDDRLLIGRRGLAAELGHVTVLPDGPLCGCGQRGHLEAVASGTAIAQWVEQELSQGIPSCLPAGETLSAQRIAEAAQGGDALAIAALARAGSFLGQAMADFLHIFNPSIIIIGGGVAQSGALLLDPMWEAMRTHVMTPSYLEDLVCTTAALGDEAGLLGALAQARAMTASPTGE